MFNIIDLLGIVVIIICALVAFKKGFVKTFFGFVSTFVAIILAFALCNAGVKILKDSTGIDEWLEQTLSASLNFDNQQQLNTSEERQEPEERQENVLSEILKNLPQNIQNSIGLEEYKEATKGAIINSSVEIILKIFSWIIIYLLVRTILLILCIVFDSIMHVPFLKQINNLAGLILGAILGLFRIYIFLAFVSFLVTFVPSIDPLVDLIKSSMMIHAMYENNILISLIF